MPMCFTSCMGYACRVYSLMEPRSEYLLSFFDQLTRVSTNACEWFNQQESHTQRRGVRMAEERKLVTILFADVTGSTALGETLDPEDVRVLMSRYYAHARRIIPAHGGTLEKFIGDAVMAVFGLPQAHSDDVERALAAALALCQA